MIRDLRIRFGVILALALTPLLVFSAWSSYYDYSRDQKLRDAVVQDAGILAVREIIDSLEFTRSLLLTTAQTINIDECEAGLKLLTRSYDSVNNMAMSGPDGRVVCSASAVASNEPGIEAATNISLKSPFYINSYHFGDDEGKPARHVILMSYGHYVDGVLTKIVFLNANVSKVEEVNKRDILPNDAEVSVFSNTGNVIVGPDNFDTMDKDIWIQSVSKNGIYKTDFTTPNGHTRTLTVLPTREPEIFVAMVALKQSLWDWNRLNPYASSIVPFLAWIFGFIAIWIATDKLLLRHLRRMELTTVNITRGAYSERLGDYQDAPKQIQDLAGSFDDVLETLKARDTKLLDSLDEKEVLLREIHHRVKNNLQIIISLLNMQKRGSQNPEFLDAIEKTHSRVSTIALVHKALYESDDIRHVEMEPYITQLVDQLSRALRTNKNNIQMLVDVSCVSRDSDQATAVGLFIVEAMSNAVQHKSLKRGVISIKIFDNMEHTTVQVIDEGVTSEVTTSGSKASLNLMRGFARQLSGSFSTSHDINRHVAELIFPFPE